MRSFGPLNPNIVLHFSDNQKKIYAEAPRAFKSRHSLKFRILPLGLTNDGNFELGPLGAFGLTNTEKFSLGPLGPSGPLK